MNCRFKPGDLVLYQHRIEIEALHGIVLGVKPSGAFRDSAGIDQIYMLEVLWDRDLPPHLSEGKGRIAHIADSVVELLEEVIGEGR